MGSESEQFDSYDQILPQPTTLDHSSSHLLKSSQPACISLVHLRKPVWCSGKASVGWASGGLNFNLLGKEVCESFIREFLKPRGKGQPLTEKLLAIYGH